jgi:hypothetical protein
MGYRLVFIDKKEIEKGESEEAGEHGFPPEVAHKTALDHLTKKDTHYYSILQKLGLEEAVVEELKEWIDSIFTKDKVGGRMGRARKELKKVKGWATVNGDTGLSGGQK